MGTLVFQQNNKKKKKKTALSEAVAGGSLPRGAGAHPSCPHACLWLDPLHPAGTEGR